MAPASKAVLVLAYGSNLDERQMRARCPSAQALATCEVPGYALAFVGHSKSRNGAVATLVPKRGSRAQGLIWRIDSKDLRGLDACEGVPSVYRRVPDFLVSGLGPVQAYLHNSTKSGLPSVKYLSLIANAYEELDFDTVPLQQAAQVLPADRPRKARVAVPSRQELLEQFKIADKKGWHEGLGAANKLLLSADNNFVISRAGGGEVLGPRAKEWLTRYFSDKGGYYGAGYPKTAVEMWMQKTEGLKALLKHLAPLRPAGVPQKWWMDHLDTLKDALAEVNTQHELFYHIDGAVQGAKFAASSGWSAARQIERLLDGAHDQEDHALVLEKVVAECNARERRAGLPHGWGL